MQRTTARKTTKTKLTPTTSTQKSTILQTKKRNLITATKKRKPTSAFSATTIPNDSLKTKTSLQSDFATSTTSIQSHFQQQQQQFSSQQSPNVLSALNEMSTIANLMLKSPKEAFSLLSQTKLAPHHPLSHRGPLRRMKHLMAQQTILATAVLTGTTPPAATDDTAVPPSALVPSDMPTTLPPPINPMRRHLPQDAAAITNGDAGINTVQAPVDGVLLQPVISDFIPPTPSRTIPIIHDGLEWDEPNFFFRPFIHVIDLLHDTTGLPWYATLISWAWILRTAISPLTYKQQASMVRFTLLQPEVLRINQELRQIDPKTNSYKQKQQELADLYKKNGVGPFTSIFWSMASIPFYILSFMAIRNMSNSPYFAAEFATGGFMPYMNLSASAGWELALVNALVNIVVLHTSQPIPVHKMAKLQKIMFGLSHVLVLGFIPILSNVNTASLMYFIANNSFSIFFQKLFYSNPFRRIAGLPTNDEVSAVRDIVTELSSKQQAARPDAGRKNAYVLEDDKKVNVGGNDVLSQARQMVHQKNADKKTFAVGGAAAIEKQRLQAERDAVAKQDAANQAAAEKAQLDKIQRVNNYRNGTEVPGKNIHTIENKGPRPESKAKTVARKGWKKH